MINKEEISKTILELEMRDTTFSNCSKLADLYVVRDHLTNKTGRYSRDSSKILEDLEYMMHYAGNENEREAIRKCIEQIRNG